MAKMVILVITAMTKKEDRLEEDKSKNKNKRVTSNKNDPQNESLPDLMLLVDKYRSHVKFIQECNVLTSERTKSLSEIDKVWDIIKKIVNTRIREDGKERGDDDSQYINIH